jgi:hypothetical protein
MANIKKIRSILISYFILELFFTILEYSMFGFITNWTFGGMALTTLVKNIVYSRAYP